MPRTPTARSAVLLAVVTLVVGGVASARAAEGAGRYANPQLLVETEEVARMLAAPDARIVDLRSEMTGWVGYRVGHVPGAAHLEVGELDDQGANAEGLPVRLAAAAAMFGRLGIDHETTVVAYDDAGGLCAARLGSWMEWANTPTRPVER